jgi:hypothetical protein
MRLGSESRPAGRMLDNQTPPGHHIFSIYVRKGLQSKTIPPYPFTYTLTRRHNLQYTHDSLQIYSLHDLL